MSICCAVSSAASVASPTSLEAATFQSANSTVFAPATPILEVTSGDTTFTLLNAITASPNTLPTPPNTDAEAVTVVVPLSKAMIIISLSYNILSTALMSLHFECVAN